MWLITLFETYGTMISTLALVATLLVLIFYTVATWSLRNQAIKQTKLSQRPFVTIYDSALSGIKYKNSGLGVALNIEIKPFRHNKYSVTFNIETVLGSKDESTLSIDPKFTNIDTNQVVPHPFAPTLLKSRNSNNVYEFEIHYEDFKRTRYKTLVKVSKEGIEYKGTDEV